jgi:hypothetical protein
MTGNPLDGRLTIAGNPLDGRKPGASAARSWHHLAGYASNYTITTRMTAHELLHELSDEHYCTCHTSCV